MPPRIKATLRTVALAACAALCIAATGKSGRSLEAPRANWNGQVAVTDNGSYRLGNPNAPVKLTEYVSYTCSHCAHYQRESDPVLRLTVIPKGQVSVTVTNLVRNPVDLTVAMLTYCGDPKRFFVRHNAFFATQDAWLAKAEAASQEQQQRWFQGRMIDRLRAIASDLGFYATMAGWNIDRAQADACLDNPAMLDKLRAQQAEVASLGLDSTPSFTLNGQVLPGHDWAAVSKSITDKLAEIHAGAI
ncbi:Protein-disulfide isomerase [Novosphingobium sp. CF614]|uniref:DsbA family protein n=1 Tax=Novosphingobium sp. CF614 TaxID=1884364 RepID=UPI0008ECBFA6|nr:thioredoxin domain-containing protein [Novosphingobium sp. CF614]SFF74814.1 Protein-disulfide isomerase [Novosphingobium sp. CF614]